MLKFGTSRRLLTVSAAVRIGMPLKIAAKVDRADQLYWQEKIRPIVEAHANVEFIGEIAEHESLAFSVKRQRCCFRWTGRSRSGW